LARHQIPAFRLPDVDRITPEVKLCLKRFENMSMSETSETCRKAMADEPCPLLNEIPRTGDFLSFVVGFRWALEALTRSLDCYPDVPIESCISGRVLQLPAGGSENGLAQMIVFYGAFAGLPLLFRLMRRSVVLPDASAFGEKGSVVEPAILSHKAAVSALDQSRDPANRFVFTPFHFFTRTQAALIRGSACEKLDTEVAADLQSLFVATQTKRLATPLRTPWSRKEKEVDSYFALPRRQGRRDSLRRLEEAAMVVDRPEVRQRLSISQSGALIHADLFFTATLPVIVTPAATPSEDQDTPFTNLRPRTADADTPSSPPRGHPIRPRTAESAIEQSSPRAKRQEVVVDLEAIRKARRKFDAWPQTLLVEMEDGPLAAVMEMVDWA
jgi:hypothetical protein